jgi:hypothetical protein
MFTSAKRPLILDVIPNANLEIGNEWMVANIVALNAKKNQFVCIEMVLSKGLYMFFWH